MIVTEVRLTGVCPHCGEAFKERLDPAGARELARALTDMAGGADDTLEPVTLPAQPHGEG